MVSALRVALAFCLALGCNKPRPSEGAANTAPPASVPRAASSATGAATGAGGAPLLTGSTGGLQKLVIDGARGVLIPGAMAGSGHFTPTEGEARRFESGLVAFLAKSRPPEDPDLHRKAGGYVRQYTGSARGGRRLLFVTFACRQDPDWGERFLVVNDGASCYFDVEYDLDAGAYTYLGVHHDA